MIEVKIGNVVLTRLNEYQPIPIQITKSNHIPPPKEHGRKTSHLYTHVPNVPILPIQC